jgi:hypothetical protein
MPNLGHGNYCVDRPVSHLFIGVWLNHYSRRGVNYIIGTALSLSQVKSSEQVHGLSYIVTEEEYLTEGRRVIFSAAFREPISVPRLDYTE